MQDELAALRSQLRWLARRVDDEHKARLRLEVEVARLHSHISAASPSDKRDASLRRRRTKSMEDIKLITTPQTEQMDSVRHAKAFAANLHKVDGKLGIGLGGGTADLPIYVHEVSKGSAAERDGRIRPGDRITHLDGTRVANLSNTETMALLKTTGDAVRLRIVRDPRLLQRLARGPPSLASGPKLEEKSRESPLRAHPVSLTPDTTPFVGCRRQPTAGNTPFRAPTCLSPHGHRSRLTLQKEPTGLMSGKENAGLQPPLSDLAVMKELSREFPNMLIRTITIKKGSSSLGITICGGAGPNSSDGIYVLTVTKDGAVDKQGFVRPRDRILRVDQHDMRTISKRDAIQVGYKIIWRGGKRRTKVWGEKDQISNRGFGK